jgi:hypothetical protein
MTRDEADPKSGVEEVGGDDVEPLPDGVVHDALRGEPEASAEVEEAWDRARSMEGEAPSG